MKHLLLTFRPFRVPQWPPSAGIHKHDDHLSVGLTAQTFEEILAALDLDNKYRRGDSEAWITQQCGNEHVGYDLGVAIRNLFNGAGLKEFSALEVLLSMNWPGVGTACVFLSHAQNEPLTLTLECMRRTEVQQGRPVHLWLDYVTLRQCVKDFELPRIEAVIRCIGHTVIIASPWQAPFAMTRTFCAFEAYVTVAAGNQIDVVVPTADLPNRFHLDDLQNVRIDVERAECRNQEDQDKIKQFIREGPGFDELNRSVGSVLQASLVGLLWRQLNGKMKISPREALNLVKSVNNASIANVAQKVFTAPGGGSETLLHLSARSSGGLTFREFEELLNMLPDPKAALTFQNMLGAEAGRHPKDNRSFLPLIQAVLDAPCLAAQERDEAAEPPA